MPSRQCRRLSDVEPRLFARTKEQSQRHVFSLGDENGLEKSNRPTYKDRHARNSSWPGELISITCRIHFAQTCLLVLDFFLQSCGGPYILESNLPEIRLGPVSVLKANRNFMDESEEPDEAFRLRAISRLAEYQFVSETEFWLTRLPQHSGR